MFNLNNYNFDILFNRRLKVLLLVSIFLLVWIAVIKIFSSYLISGADNNWQEISAEKTELNEKKVIGIFNKYQQDVSSFSDFFVKTPQLKKGLSSADSRQVFDAVLKTEIDPSYQIEVYNKWLQLLAYKGRQLEPEYILLQRAINNNKISVIRDIGLYTYLLVYSPIKDVNDTNAVSGVAVTAKLLDIRYQIENKFFPSEGITQEVQKAAGVNIELIPANTISGITYIDSIKTAENRILDLISINNNVIGKILLPKYDKQQHYESITALSTRINSILIFILSVILIVITLSIIYKLKKVSIRLAILFVLLALIRYLWLQFDFPAGAIESDIFSPVYYASTFGFGIVKSVGDLLVTSIFVLLFSLFAAYYVIKQRGFNFSRVSEILLFCGSVIFFYFITRLFAVAVESIIYDSNITFFDKSQIIPSIELFSIQLTIIILSFSFILLLSALFYGFYRLIKSSHFLHYSIKQYPLISTGIFFLLLNIAAELVLEIGIGFWHRTAILLLVWCFTVFIVKKNFAAGRPLFNIRTFSFAFLAAIAIVPAIMLDKITSQEQKYVELMANNIAENDIERINFLIVNELTTQSKNPVIEENLKNPNKISKSAFHIWADSKLNTENFNSSVILLDTARRILSDFNINDEKLNSDSLVSFIQHNFFNEGFSFTKDNIIIRDEITSTMDTAITESEFEEEEMENFDSETSLIEPYIYDNIAVIKSEPDKFYIGIAPIQKQSLLNTEYARILGYIIIAVHYESKNFLLQSSLEIFKNYTKDNTLDKLVSKPVITEYINGEVVSSTEPDISKTATNSVLMFKDHIKVTNKTADWRFETINNEKYKSYFILADKEQSTGDEKIYSISLKRDDFKVSTFYYLKFILFSIFIYLIFYLFFGSYFIFTNRRITLNFREKLFLSFFVVSVIPIILLALYTRAFIIDKTEQSLQSQIISDLNIFNEPLSQDNLTRESIRFEDTLQAVKGSFLSKINPQSNKNYNLFIKHNLLTTTNEELYKSDLLDTRVDADAFYNLFYLKKDLFLENQDIGALSFLVGYKPVKDVNNSFAGILSLQLVYKQNELNEELTESLTYIFGIYFIVIIVLLIVVSFLTERISRPILQLKSATEKIGKGGRFEKISVDEDDEFADLITSFNNMTMELERSQEQLKKAEREAAWRDIARRVAHEIKNPLTPMKLSIQHLNDIYMRNGKDDFPGVLNKTRQLIINEIDKLNRIATEFSNFAKLPTRNYEPLNVNSIIEDVIALYEQAPAIKFVKELSPDIPLIMADKQEMNRVFQNLIKNSIQAIYESGQIIVRSYNYEGKVIVEVEDNGCGMDAATLKKLFEPNFSTKSSGMGLGLAISKKSLDDMKADIHFVSVQNQGTKVILTFEQYNKVNA